MRRDILIGNPCLFSFFFVRSFKRRNVESVITACIPQSWGNEGSFEAATSETFSSANVVIDGINMDTPNTRMSRECGEPGEFIQLPVKYITATLHNIVQLFGYPGKNRFSCVPCSCNQAAGKLVGLIIPSFNENE